MGEPFALEELEVIDSTIKMFTMPVLKADVPLLQETWKHEQAVREARLQKLGVSVKELRSADKFAALLRQAGVEPETKDGKNGDIFAFAKTDMFMVGLLDSDDETVRTLAEARLGSKSSIIQERCVKIADMASRGNLAIYLNYAGAHTTRWSSGDGMGFQNLTRGSALRKAIMAPPGCLILSPDLSQIEFRVGSYLAGQWDIIELLRAGNDPYIGTAARFYGVEPTKVNKTQRHLGKVIELACLFGMSWRRLQATCKVGALGGPPIFLSDEEAKSAIEIYRNSHPAVVNYWKEAGRMIARLAGGDPLQWGPVTVKDGKLWAPNGTMLHYPHLHYHRPTAEECEKLPEWNWNGYWRYRNRHGWTNIYASLLVENVVQWLSRIVLSQAMLRIKALGYHIMGTTHDELWVLLKQDGNEERHREIIMNEMRREVSWLPGLPLDCEAEMGSRYEH